ncbi:MAG: septal ring lytic transglycosylase RlpA family protein [Ignavibacteria bacterium]|nr:septal ring lytic transglycosylase RlpA family protein [Ignavibacteria bacterium]
MRAILAYGVAAALGLPLAVALHGCASTKSTERNPVLTDSSVRVYETSEGLASYYSNKFQGRKTANGERYDRRRLTAAHPRYPFGTWLRVTSLATGRDVVVRVNDRGPNRGSRVVDLSYAAASQIGMLRAGITGVRLEVIDWPEGRDPRSPTSTPTPDNAHDGDDGR